MDEPVLRKVQNLIRGEMVAQQMIGRLFTGQHFSPCRLLYVADFCMHGCTAALYPCGVGLWSLSCGCCCRLTAAPQQFTVCHVAEPTVIQTCMCTVGSFKMCLAEKRATVFAILRKVHPSGDVHFAAFVLLARLRAQLMGMLVNLELRERKSVLPTSTSKSWRSQAG